MHLVYACTFAHMYVLMCLCVCVCMYIKTNIGGGGQYQKQEGQKYWALIWLVPHAVK